MVGDTVSNRESRTVFVDKALGFTFHCDSSSNVLCASTTLFGRAFESLPPEAQSRAAELIGFEPERIGIESIGRVVGAARAGLAWLEADPNRTLEELERLVIYAE